MTKIKSSRSWLARKSPRPRPLNTSIFVPRKYGAVTTRISKFRNNWCCGIHRDAIPTIRESRNPLIQGHDVQDRSRMNPPAQGCAFTGVFGESERAKAFAKRSVFGIGADFTSALGKKRPFALTKIAHTKNTICCWARKERATSSTPKACGLLLRHQLGSGARDLPQAIRSLPGWQTRHCVGVVVGHFCRAKHGNFSRAPKDFSYRVSQNRTQ
jgi:hypothetical protein